MDPANSKSSDISPPSSPMYPCGIQYRLSKPPNRYVGTPRNTPKKIKQPTKLGVFLGVLTMDTGQQVNNLWGLPVKDVVTVTSPCNHPRQ
eukprot:1082102-Amphidinium_carterae.1